MPDVRKAREVLGFEATTTLDQMLDEVIPWIRTLNGRTIVYGSSYCSQAPLAKYSDASFWKPYVEMGGGDVSCGALGRREDRRRLVDHRRRRR